MLFVGGITTNDLYQASQWACNVEGAANCHMEMVVKGAVKMLTSRERNDGWLQRKQRRAMKSLSASYSLYLSSG